MSLYLEDLRARHMKGGILNDRLRSEIGLMLAQAEREKANARIANAEAERAELANLLRVTLLVAIVARGERTTDGRNIDETKAINKMISELKLLLANCASVSE